jgi:hypothetical protein
VPCAIFFRRSVVPASKLVVSSGGRSEPFRHRWRLEELEGTGFSRIDSDFCNNHSRQVGECPQEACSCGDCGHIRIGRGRDNRIPTQATAWQGRPPEPLLGDESRLGCSSCYSKYPLLLFAAMRVRCATDSYQADGLIIKLREWRDSPAETMSSQTKNRRHHASRRASRG